MKQQHPILLLLLCATLGLPSGASPSGTRPAKPAADGPQEAKPQSPGALEPVLKRLDATATSFHTLEADFDWDQYFKVVNETDVQTGKIYFRRSGQNTDMSAVIAKVNGRNQLKYVIFSDNKVQVYQPTVSDVIDVYGTGNNREMVESFLVLGFGGSGREMQKAFDITYIKKEKLDGIETDELDLVPKSANLQEKVGHILLWIDPARGVSVQQQFFFTGEGDYRLAKFSNIRLNGKISDAVFKLKKTDKTQINNH